MTCQSQVSLFLYGSQWQQLHILHSVLLWFLLRFTKIQIMYNVYELDMNPVRHIREQWKVQSGFIDWFLRIRFQSVLNIICFEMLYNMTRLYSRKPIFYWSVNLNHKRWRWVDVLDKHQWRCICSECQLLPLHVRIVKLVICNAPIQWHDGNISFWQFAGIFCSCSWHISILHVD